MNNLVKIIVSMLLLITIIFPVTALDVSGYVKDGAGTGINNVTVYDSLSINTTLTNNTGYYILTGYSTNTSYNIIASKTGLKTVNKYVTFTIYDTLRHNFIMRISLTAFLGNLNSIINALVIMFTTILTVFMQPPISIFIGVILFVAILNLIGSYLVKKSKRI